MTGRCDAATASTRSTTTSNPAAPSGAGTDGDARVRAVELLISRLLQAGVAASVFFIVTGAGVSFVHHPDYRSAPEELRRLTSPGAAFPHTLRQVWQGVRDLRGQALVTVGLLLLIGTPVLRVAVSIVAFAYQRDWTFVAVTSVVLALLVLSFALGKSGGG